MDKLDPPLAKAYHLIRSIKQWHHDRNLIDGATDKDQLAKLIQEMGELSDNICKGKDIKDDIGDMMVVLINIMVRNNLTINQCLAKAYEDIKDILKTIDFYKSDTSRVFSINLLNIINFQKDLMIKISSICNELNLSIDIHLNEINNLSDNETNALFKFWEEINLLNNCVVHDFLTSRNLIRNYVGKNKIRMYIKYSVLLELENFKLLLSLKPNNNRYIPATAAVIPLKANPEIAFIFFCFMTLDLSGNKLIFFTAVTNL